MVNSAMNTDALLNNRYRTYLRYFLKKRISLLEAKFGSSSESPGDI